MTTLFRFWIGFFTLAVFVAFVGCAESQQKGKSKMKATFVKAGKFKGTPVKAKKGDAAPGDFALVEGTNDDVLVQGDNGTGVGVDLSAVATVAATSSDPTVVVIGPATPASPVSYNEKALKAGTSTITVVATWGDGSVGPFTLTYTDTVSPAPPPAVTGLIIVHGPVTVNTP